MLAQLLALLAAAPGSETPAQAVSPLTAQAAPKRADRGHGGLNLKGGRCSLKFSRSWRPRRPRPSPFALRNAASKEEAIAYCQKFLTVAGDGTCEIRQILEFAPRPA